MVDWQEQYSIWLADKAALTDQLIPMLPDNYPATCVDLLHKAIDEYFAHQLYCATTIDNEQARKEIKSLASSSSEIAKILKERMPIIQFILANELQDARLYKFDSDLHQLLKRLQQFCVILGSLANFADSDWPRRKVGRPENKAKNKFISDLTNIFELAGGEAHLNIDADKKEHYGPYYEFIRLACRLVGDELHSGQSLEKILSRHIKQP